VRRRRIPSALLALLGIEPLDQQDTVEVIELVLEDPSLQFRCLDRQFVPFEVETHQMHGVRSHDLPTQAGNRQAPLVVDPLAVRSRRCGG